MSADFGRRQRMLAVQPAIVTYIEDRLTHEASRRVALELLDNLLAAYARWTTPLSAVGVIQLDAAEHATAEGDVAHPVTGWQHLLPVALQRAERRSLSRVMVTVVHALDKSQLHTSTARPKHAGQATTASEAAPASTTSEASTPRAAV